MRFLITSFLLLTYSYITTAQEINPNFKPKLTGLAKVHELVTTANGDIFFSGDFTSINGNYQYQEISKINSSGELSSDFKAEVYSPNLSNFKNEIITPLSSGELLIAGAIFGDSVWISKVNAQGKVIDTLKTPENFITISDIKVQADGKILVAGNIRQETGAIYGDALIRFNIDGAIDESFNVNVINNKSSSTFGLGPFIKPLDNGQIYFMGQFTDADNLAYERLVRLNEDGSVDTDFTNTNVSGTVLNVFPDELGRIVVAGYFDTIKGMSIPSIARLNVDGSIDQTFLTDYDPISFVKFARQLNNGKYFVQDFSHITLLDENFQVDQTFVPTRINGDLRGANSLANNQIVIAGLFTEYDNLTANSLIRLNEDATLDQTFNYDLGKSTELTNMITYDGDSILLVGEKISIDQSLNQDLLKISRAADISETFNLGSGASRNNLNFAEFDKDGNIYTGGVFSSFNGVNANGIVKLNKKGNVIESFMAKLSNDTRSFDVRTACVLENGKVLIGGDFTEVDDFSINNLAKLNADGSLDKTFASVINNEAIVTDIKRKFNGNFLVSYDVIGFTSPSDYEIIEIDADGNLIADFKKIIIPELTIGKFIQFENHLIVWTYDQTTRTSEIRKYDNDGTFIETLFGDIIINDIIQVSNNDFIFATPDEVIKMSLDGETDESFSLNTTGNITSILYDGDSLWMAGSVTMVDSIEVFGVAKASLIGSTPKTPTNFEVTHLSIDSLTLNWVDSEIETKYELYKKINDGALTLEATLNADEVAYTDRQVVQGDMIEYQLRALTVTKNSGFAKVVVSIPTITALEALDRGSFSRIYPNPSNGIYNIRGFKSDIFVSLYSLTGHQILVTQLDKNNNYTLDLSGLPDGIYVLNIMRDNAKEIIRLIKN